MPSKLTINGSGAKAVGNAVNETEYLFMKSFLVDVVVTAIGIRMTAH